MFHRPFNDLLRDWSEVLEGIRSVSCFHSFLKSASFPELQWAAEKGPVIVVNISKHGSSAIIALRDAARPLQIPLPKASPTVVERLSDFMRKHMEATEVPNRDTVAMLREVWDVIVGPIAETLIKDVGLPPKARIWWCPTGVAALLPLHAAGPCERGKQNMNQIYVSSYIPSLGALVRARREWSLKRREDPLPSILVVAVTNPGDRGPLPGGEEEVKHLIRLAPKEPTVLQEFSATREAILGGMMGHSWVHVVSHGEYDEKEAFSSRICLSEGHEPLTLRDLLGKTFPKAELAVINTCNSGRLGGTLPDEHLHLLGGMMGAGFPSVVGCLSKLEDGFSAAVMEKFYEEMLGRADGVKDASDAASALCEAAFHKELNLGRRPTLMERISYTHFGI